MNDAHYTHRHFSRASTETCEQHWRVIDCQSAYRENPDEPQTLINLRNAYQQLSSDEVYGGSFQDGGDYGLRPMDDFIKLVAEERLAAKAPLMAQSHAAITIPIRPAKSTASLAIGEVSPVAAALA